MTIGLSASTLLNLSFWCLQSSFVGRSNLPNRTVALGGGIDQAAEMPSNLDVPSLGSSHLPLSSGSTLVNSAPLRAGDAGFSFVRLEGMDPSDQVSVSIFRRDVYAQHTPSSRSML